VEAVVRIGVNAATPGADAGEVDKALQIFPAILGPRLEEASTMNALTLMLTRIARGCALMRADSRALTEWSC
jgi:hypothetical protein